MVFTLYVVTFHQKPSMSIVLIVRDHTGGNTSFNKVALDVVGYRFTGSNGGSIFLPAAGCYLGSKCYELNEGCHYWSGTPYYECGDCEADDTQANCLTVIDGDYIDVLFTYRSAGLSVRPVITKDAPVE